MRKVLCGFFSLGLPFALMVVLIAVPGQAQIALQSGAPNFGVQAVGQPTTTALTFYFTQEVILGGAPAVVTQGYAGLDFTSPAGTCVAGQWIPGETCTVQVTFTPLYPGLRMGAVVFRDGGGSTVGTIYLQGVGSGSLPPPGTDSPSISFSFPLFSVAVDAGGYVYVTGNGGVYKMTASLTGPAMVTNGFSLPQSVAVDGAGNLYVADYNNNGIWKVSPDGNLKTQLNFPSTLTPEAVVVDGAGVVYAADWLAGTIWQLGADGVPTQFATGFGEINALALDGAGNLYVADDAYSCTPTVPPACGGSNQVWQVEPGGTQTRVWPAAAQASTSPWVYGVAVDGVGNVYVVDSLKNIWKVAPGQTPVRVATGITDWKPEQIALDGAGDAYVTDMEYYAVMKVSGIDSLPAIVDGACGAANGQSLTTAPAQPVDLCSAGVPSAVTGSGPWSWSCTGLNGGVTVACTTSYAVTFTVNTSSGGSLTGNTTQTVAPGGSTTAVTANAASGYFFDGWTNASGAPYSTDNPLTVTDVQANLSLTANFTVGNCAAAGTLVKTSGEFSAPSVIDSQGNTYQIITVVVSDTAQHYVEETAPKGTTKTIMGPDRYYSGLALDAADNLYVGEQSYKGGIYKRDPKTGAVTTVVTGLSYPCELAADPTGKYLYFTNCSDTNVYKVDAATGLVTTLTLNVPAAPPYYQPYRATLIKTDSLGNVYVVEDVDYAPSLLTIEIMSGNCATTNPVNGVCGNAADEALSIAPVSLADLCTTGAPSSVVGFGPWAWSCAGVNGGSSTGFCSTAGGNPDYIVTFGVNNASAGALAGTNPQMVIAGGGTTPVTAAANDGFTFLNWIDSNGNLVLDNPFTINNVATNLGLTANFVPGSNGCPASGIVTAVAGNGVEGYSGDGKAAVVAELSYPSVVAVDGGGKLYIGDYDNYRIRKVDATGVISTVAGNGTYGYTGDTGAATAAEIGDFQDGGVALDTAGNLYIGDYDYSVVRRVDAQTGIITTIAGGGNGCTSYPCAAVNLELWAPDGVAIDASGFLYIADNAESGSYLYKVDTSTFTVTTAISSPVILFGVSADPLGNVLFWGFYGDDDPVERLAPDGTITTVAGCTGSCSPVSDGLPATTVELDDITGVAGDASGNTYVLVEDNESTRIYKVDATTNAITRIAGTGYLGFGGLNGPALNAQFGWSYSLALDAAGNLYFADSDNNRVDAIWSGTCQTQAQTITFPNPGTQTYGVAPFALTATASAGASIVYSVVSGLATVSGNMLSITGAGSVTVQAALASSGQTATPVSVTFTVNPLDLTITANSATKTYGDTLTFAGTEFTASGLINSDTVTSVTLTSLGAPAAALVGGSPYAIEASAAQGTGLGNYNIFYATGTLTVQPATPALTLTCPEVPYDGSLHACACTATGLGGADLSGVCALTPTRETVAGSYPVTAIFTPNDLNYTSATATGTLIIDKVNQNPSPVCPAPVIFDGQAHSCTVQGFGTCTSTSATNVPGGTVALNCAGDANYNAWTGAGAIVINPATPAVKVTCPTVTYDGNPHTCTATAAGVGGAAVSGSFTFTPGSETVAGSYPEMATFSSSDSNYGNGSGSGTLVINAVPTGTVSLTLSTTAVTFPGSIMIGQSSPAQYVTIMSTGTALLQVSGVTIGGANPGDFIVTNQAGTCTTGATLVNHADCNLRVVFAPAAVGTRSAILYINDNLAGSPQQVTVSGTAISGAQLSQSATTLTFPATTVGATAATQYLTLKSTGFQSVVVNKVVLSSGDFDLSDQAGTCTTAATTSLVPGADCNIRVKFHPTATGARTATVVISSNSPASPQTVTLNGTGQ